MENFLISLDTDYIFHQYKNTPNDAEFAQLQKLAKHNIDFTIDYIKVKVAAIAVIEALALVTGGDCSIYSFLGDFHTTPSKMLRACDYLPEIAIPQPVQSDLMKVLECGRSYPSCYDLNESPITAFMCKLLGQETVMRIAIISRAMFTGELSPQEFIRQLDPELVRIIAGACAKITHSRAPALLALEVFA